MTDQSPDHPTLAAGSYLFPENETKTAYVRCQCGHAGWIDQDQWTGDVSIDCPACSYHETVDLRKHHKVG